MLGLYPGHGYSHKSHAKGPKNPRPSWDTDRLPLPGEAFVLGQPEVLGHSSPHQPRRRK